MFSASNHNSHDPRLQQEQYQHQPQFDGYHRPHPLPPHSPQLPPAHSQGYDMGSYGAYPTEQQQQQHHFSQQGPARGESTSSRSLWGAARVLNTLSRVSSLLARLQTARQDPVGAASQVHPIVVTTRREGEGAAEQALVGAEQLGAARQAMRTAREAVGVQAGVQGGHTRVQWSLYRYRLAGWAGDQPTPSKPAPPLPNSPSARTGAST